MTSQNPNYLWSGVSWNKSPGGTYLFGQPLSITYTYLRTLPIYYQSNLYPEFQGVPSAATIERWFDAARNAWSDVANIQWQSVTQYVTESNGTVFENVGHVTFGYYSIPNNDRGEVIAGEARFPGTSQDSGDVFLNPNIYGGLVPAMGSQRFVDLVHEIGHALGLDHPGGKAEIQRPLSAVQVPSSENYTLYTVMSYSSGPLASAFLTPITPMVLDIAAIQGMYGSNNTVRVGATPYRFGPNEHPFSSLTEGIYDEPARVMMTLWDGDGITPATSTSRDFIDASAMRNFERVWIDLRPGEYSSIGTAREIGRNVGIAFGTIIEDAIGGAGDDSIVGNDVTNILEGNGGNDSLNGGAGADELYGERKGTTLPNGAAGNDTFDGGTAIGQTWDDGVEDTLVGGVGSDTYIVHQSAGNQKGVADKIIDSGWNLVVVHDASGTPVSPLNNRMLFKRDPAQLVWTNPESGIPGSAPTLKLSINSPATIIDDQRNATVILGNAAGDFQSGDFGITLRDAPTAVGLTVTGYTTANDTQTGAASNDRMQGLAGRDSLSGGDGADWLEGGVDGTYFIGATPYLGGDILFGGLGNDVLIGNSSTVLGTAGETLDDIAARIAQTIASTSTTLGDLLSGGVGEDTLIACDGINFLAGGSGGDLLVGGIGDDYLFGGYDATSASFNWAPTITGDSFTFDPNVGGLERTDDIGDAIYAGAGNDRAYGGAGDDYLDLGQGNDIATGGAGNDVLLGGDGNDTILGDSNVASGTDGMDFLDGGAGNDTLAGGGNDDYLLGGAGDDILAGESGNDVLIGGKGNDTLEGGAGRDTYYFNRGDGVDTIIDTPASATLADGSPNPEASVLVLGEGIARSQIRFGVGSLKVDLGLSDLGNPGGPRDQIHFTEFSPLDPASTSSVAEIRFADGSVMTYADILAQGFDVDGTPGNDSGTTALLGTNNAVGDRIRGFAGNDQLYGYAGNDMLDGGDGDDYLYGDVGNDLLFGGAGNDTVRGVDGDDVAEGGDGNDSMYGGAGADTLRGGSGGDYLYAFEDYSFETNDGNGNVLEGVDGDDFLYGAAGGDTLRGDAGSDLLRGSGGTDQLYGGSGDDTLDGGSESDTLVGGTGNDTLKGGARPLGYWQDQYGTGIPSNRDTYVFQRGDGVDTIDDPDDGWGPTHDNPDASIIELEAGINRTDLVFGRNGTGGLGEEKFRIDLGYGDAIIFGGNPTFTASSNLSQNKLVGEIRFANGDKIFSYEIQYLGYTLNGTQDSQTLIGGFGNDRINGLAGNDTLSGYFGDDTLDGGTGNDSIDGGPGADTYVFGVGDGQDVINVSQAQNLDVIRFRQGVLPTDVVVSQLGSELTLTYSTAGDSVKLMGELTGWTPSSDGNVQASKMLKEVRFDTGEVWSFATLLGKLRIINGTPGNDPSLTANANAPSTLRGLGGNDTLTGNAQDSTLEGGEGNDTINGGSGNEWLDGGVGADQMSGGAGNDFYIRDNAGDEIIEDPGPGTDLVQVSVTTTLTDNVENLRLVGTLPINGIGNALNNRIEGSSGDNTLDGGTGADTLIGGAGNDTYIVDNLSDSVAEFLGNGTDLVQASVSFTLGDDLENLTLTGSGHNDATGNAIANGLVGNVGNNLIDGASGADTMQGGAGDDTYVVDNILDAVTELDGEGSDSVRSSIGFDLTTRQYVENVTLTGGASVNATGNAVANRLTGNSGANVLHGGLGADTLTGGGGDDTLIGDNQDRAVVSGRRGEYVIFNYSGDTWVLDRQAGRDGQDKINGILNLWFELDEAGVSLANTRNPLDYIAAYPDLINFYGANEAGGFHHLITWGAAEGRTITFDAVAYADTNLDLRAYYTNPVTGILHLRDLATHYIQWGAGEGRGATLNGDEGTDVVRGGVGHDLLDGRGGNDLLFAGIGNDTLIGGVGNDALDGGQGFDSAIFSASRSNYIITQPSAGTFHIVGAEGTDVVVDVEVLRFGDDSITLLARNAGATAVIDNFNPFLYLASNPDVLSVLGASTNAAMDHYVTWGYAEGRPLSGFHVYEYVASNPDLFPFYGANVVGSAEHYMRWGRAEGRSTTSFDGAQYLVNYADVAPVYGATEEGAATHYVMFGHVEGRTDMQLVFTGTTGNDTLTGNAANNILDGGDGNDTLSGGTGADSFFFITALNSSTNVDAVSDFVPGTDKLVLDHVIFSQLAAGSLSAGNLAKNTNGVAVDADDYVVYNTSSGLMRYDPDGNGSQSATPFAVLATLPNVTAADFLVV